MPFTAIFFCLSLLAAFHASAQSTCTTLQPVFELPLDATSTAYRSTITSTSSVDCAGCSLVVSTFRATTLTPVNDLPAATSRCKRLTTYIVGNNANDHRNGSYNNICNLHLPARNIHFDRYFDELHRHSHPHRIASSPSDPNGPGTHR